MLTDRMIRGSFDLKELLTIQWFQSRWHKPEEVFLMRIHITPLLGIVPSILKPL